MKTFSLAHRKFLPFSLLMVLAAWSVDARALTADDLAGVWTGNAVLTACGAGCGSPIGLTYASDLSITPTGSNSFDGAFIWGAVGTGTLVVTSVNFSFTYTYATSWGNCSGTVDGNSMTMSCDHYLGDGRFNGRTAVYLTHTVRPGPSPTPSPSPAPIAFSFQNIEITQAVPDFKLDGSPADIDLVLGKSTAILFDAKVTGASASDTTPVSISVHSSSGTTIAALQLTVGEIASSTSISGSANSKSFTLTDPAYVPTVEGLSRIAFAMSSTKGSSTVEKLVRVKRTNPLSIAYFPVIGPFDCPHEFPSSQCSGPFRNDTLENYAQNATKFAQGTFPIADGGVTGQAYGNSAFLGISGPDLQGASNPVLGSTLATKDIANLALEKTVLNFTADSFVGVVPQSYFSYRGLDGAVGFALRVGDKSLRTTLSAEGFWTTTAHEIAHTFGADHESLQNVNGYWVTDGGMIKNSQNMMTTEPDSNVSIFQTLSSQWISAATYGTIFRNNVSVPNDPELLVLGGLIHKDGSVEFLPTGYLPAGFETGVTEGEDSLATVKDEEGNVISAASFNTSFSAEAISASGLPKVLETDIAPFVVKVPIGSDAASIEIISKGEKIADFFPMSELISDTIKTIAAKSFRHKAELTREKLLKRAAQVDRLAKFCRNYPGRKRGNDRYEDDRDEQCSQLRVNLTFVLREAVNKALNDSLIKEKPLSLTKNEALRNIDAAILRIIPNQSVFGKKKEYALKILPYRSVCRDDQLFQIVSVTQGEFGTVSIERSASVVYRPNTSRSYGDSFTVTIRNAWGSVVTKTIKIDPGKR